MRPTFLKYLLIFSVVCPAFGQVFVKKTFFDADTTHLKEMISLSEADSSLQGLYQSFYLNGSLESRGYYHNNESDSTWAFFYENGQKKAEGKFRDGSQVGKWIYYFENGNMKVKGAFKDDAKHGSWTFFFENGNEKSAGIYYEGKKEGIWNYQYEDGTLKAQAFFNLGRGIYKEFYPDGSLKMEGKNVDEKSEGNWTYYYQSGELEAHGDFHDGLRNGYWKYYHKNGQVAAEGLFVDGQKSGPWKYYYSDGSVSSEGPMRQDQKDGYWKLYYPSGIVQGEGEFEVGTGNYQEYYESGKQKASGELLDGQKHGDWVFYNEEGLEDGVAHYDKGHGTYMSYYPDGSLKMEGELHGDRRVGKWILYNPDGSVAGVYRPVYEDEKPIFRTSESIAKQEKEFIDKPEYKYKSNSIRYFVPRQGEFKGYIFATNPFWTLFGELPIAAEYYIQERLGYELELTIINDPFFEKAEINKVSTNGVRTEFRQKFYHLDKKLGMFYFGHQIMLTYKSHQINKLDSIFNPLSPREIGLKANESQFAYGLFIGNRWMQRPGNAGVTLDFHLGISVGTRLFSKKYASTTINEGLFNQVPQRTGITPIIFGVNIGFSGPKRPSPSF
ncbi:toxin-antitoxin system YwqK family antitoxin [Marinoscillum sp. MHG1-6]|uniref:toxin-antitoxin system YwqK family antitoxin n=1 Tax=Marinoscillum sp. MHG1-6 TaxID=2959627 RepID=UPI0021578DCD|nr:toxin-antitoxin system YwqK family antitoxin [Marinoscillum sp. MHG1-6]